MMGVPLLPASFSVCDWPVLKDGGALSPASLLMSALYPGLFTCIPRPYHVEK